MRPMKGRIINEQYYMHFICEQLVILVVNCRLVVMGKVGHKMRDSQLKSVRKWTSRVACTHVSSLRTHQIIIIIVIIASLLLNTAGAGRHLVFETPRWAIGPDISKSITIRRHGMWREIRYYYHQRKRGHSWLVVVDSVR